jgi:YbgC/YbaW family acyl-CoA thioester hydrolase
MELRARTAVLWGDCDPAGIAHYPRVFAWLDLASHALARALGYGRDQWLEQGVGFPLVRATAEFLAPARFEDELEVRGWVTRVGRSSFSLRLELWRLGPDGEALLARGAEDRVHVRRVDGALRSQPFSREMRARMLAFRPPANVD